MTTELPANVQIRANASSPLSHEGADNDQPSGHTAIEMTTFCILWILSLTGNILVCVVIRRSRRVHSTTNYFVVSIAASDIVLTTIPLPFLAGNIISVEWLFGDFMCKIIRLLQYAAPGVTVYVLTSICIDRYYSIIYPLSFKIKRSTAKRMILICWVLAYALSSFSVYFFPENTMETTDRTYKVCPKYLNGSDWMGVGFILTLVLLEFIFPVLFMIVLYTKVFKYIWKAGITGARRIQRTMNPVSRTKVNMVKMLMISTAITIILMCPFYGTHLWFTFSSRPSENHSLYIFCVCFVFCTAALKPLIYMYYNANFRRGCKEVFCFSSSKCYRSNTYAITTASSIGKRNHVGVMNSDPGQAVDSPSKIFDRSLQIDQSMWPFENNNVPPTWH